MKQLFVAFTCTLFLFCVPVFSDTAIIFDIHGVLLEENIEQVVREKVKQTLTELAQTNQSREKETSHGEEDRSSHTNEQLIQKSLWEKRTYVRLCEILKEQKPLSDYPVILEAESSTVPYEVYALFAGYITPEVLYPRLVQALEQATYESLQEKILIRALVDALFDRESLIAAMKPITQGVALLTVLSQHYPIYIFSNAPRTWVSGYRAAFPEIFNCIPEDHIITSSDLGTLKPSARAYITFAEHVGRECSSFILFDDSDANINGAFDVTMRGITIDYTKSDEILMALTELKLLQPTEIDFLRTALTLPTKKSLIDCELFN